MAGSNIYLEPIITNAVAGIPAMVQEMGVMVAEMQQSTRILSNILSNTGLTQSQTAFSGATLAAETLISNSGLSGEGTLIDLNNIIYSPSIKMKVSDFPKSFLKCDFDFSNLETLVLNYNHKTSDKTGFNANLTITANIYIDNELIDSINVTGGYTEPDDGFNFTQTINVSNIIGVHLLEIKYTTSNTGSTTWSYGNAIIAINFSDGLQVFKKLCFNNENCITLDNSETYLLYAPFPAIGYIDFTDDIYGASLWNSLIVNGNLTGVTMSIIDSTTLEKIMDLPASINDISTLTQLTNFSIKFEFGEGSEDSYISAVIFRYY